MGDTLESLQMTDTERPDEDGGPVTQRGHTLADIVKILDLSDEKAEGARTILEGIEHSSAVRHKAVLDALAENRRALLAEIDGAHNNMAIVAVAAGNAIGELSRTMAANEKAAVERHDAVMGLLRGLTAQTPLAREEPE